MTPRNPVNWFEIYVDDLKRAQKFYESVLNLKLSELPMPESPDNPDTSEMLAFPMEMEGEGAAGALVKMDGFKAGGNSTLIYFNSTDCKIEEGKIKGAGGKIFKPKESIGEFGFIVLAYDSEGNMFGVHSEK